jgi:riboflavin transporter FmnP
MLAELFYSENIQAPEQEKKPMNQKTRKLAVIAMLSAVAFVLQFFDFPIPIMPGFIKMDVSDLPAIIGAFALGPVSGAVIEVLKNLLHFILDNSGTGGVGELSNALLGIFLVVPAGLIYRRKHNKKGAIVGALVGSVCMGIISVPSNYFIVYPVYYNFMPQEVILGAYQTILPGMKSILQCLVVFNMPFTFVKGLLASIVTILIYKPLSPLLHGKSLHSR